MKARSKELLDRAVAATVAAIEIYNKPDFLYREEAFAVLAINGWELLLKAKWLAGFCISRPQRSQTAATACLV